MTNQETIMPEQMEWCVTIQRTEYRSHSFIARGDTQEEAEAHARAQADAHNFHDNSVEHAEESIISTMPHAPTRTYVIRYTPYAGDPYFAQCDGVVELFTFSEAEDAIKGAASARLAADMEAGDPPEIVPATPEQLEQVVANG